MERRQRCSSVAEYRTKGLENVQLTPAYPEVTPDSNGILICLDWTWGLGPSQYPSPDTAAGHGAKGSTLNSEPHRSKIASRLALVYVQRHGMDEGKTEGLVWTQVSRKQNDINGWIIVLVVVAFRPFLVWMAGMQLTLQICQQYSTVNK